LELQSSGIMPSRNQKGGERKIARKGVVFRKVIPVSGGERFPKLIPKLLGSERVAWCREKGKKMSLEGALGFLRYRKGAVCFSSIQKRQNGGGIAGFRN